MKTFSLSFPQLCVSVNVPDEVSTDFQTAFFHSIKSETNLSYHCEYVVMSDSNTFTLFKNGQEIHKAGSYLELICILEMDIETTLTENIGFWVCFHAGAVQIGDSACIIPGNPDTGKTITTLNLVELGAVFLCEEVAPVDPETLLVYPYPQVLSLDASYAKTHQSLYSMQNGKLQIVSPHMARYCPIRTGTDPVPLKTILLPKYDPLGKTGVEKVKPEDALTELLGYCFPPNTDDERLFDSVIKVCNTIDIIRLQTNSVQSLRLLLQELLG